jgi:dihydrofolate synthase/folylpolyglutamate synthase
VWWDGAHNPHGARALRRAWREGLGDAPAALVLGCSRDKDLEGLLDALAGPWSEVVACAPESGRALPADELARRAAAAWDVPARPAASVAEALATALDGLPRGGRALVTGSLFTVGEAMAALGDPPPEELP